MSEFQIAVPGVRDTLPCFVEGQGPPLVVQAPGWGTGSALFRQTFGPLKAHFTLVSFDPRGSGASPGHWASDDIHIGAQAEDLKRVIGQLDLGKVSLLGHSHGAWIALRYATEFGQNLNRLVLVGPEADHIDGFEEAQRAFINERRARPDWVDACDAFSDALTNGFADLVTDHDLVAWFRRVLPLYAHDPARLIHAFGRCDLPPLRMDALRSTMQTNHLFPVMKTLHRITCPTLLVTGSAEWTGVRMLAARLAAGIPLGECLEVAQSGHFPWLENPDQFFLGVHRFLMAHQPSAA